MDNKSLTNYRPQKYTTALEALKAHKPSISRIKRDRSEVELRVNIAAILERLFSARFSKQQLNQVLCDEFTDWLLTEYYFLKLPEIELALMNYRGEIFHVIDLEALKTMIETFDMERCHAVEKLKPETETPKNGTPMPERTKQLCDELAVKGKKEKPFGRLPKSLEELLEIQKFKNVKDAAYHIRGDWEMEWEMLTREINKYRELATKSGDMFNEPNIGTKEQFVRQKESIFIYNSQIRIYG